MAEKLKAQAQYNDILGSTAADGDYGTPLNDIAKEIKIPEEYDIIGASFFLSHNKLISLSLYGILKSENISYEHTNESSIKVKRFETKLSLDDFFQKFKRFDSVLIDKKFENTEIYIEED